MPSWDQNKQLFKTANLSKAERIQFARDNGLNVLEYTAIESVYDAEDLLVKYGEVSIRCEPGVVGTLPEYRSLEWEIWDRFIDKKPDEWTMPPHFPCVPKIYYIGILEQLFRRGWHPLVSDGLSFNDNIMSGTLTVNSQRRLVELTIGPGCSVRNITHGMTPDMIFSVDDVSGRFISNFKDIIKKFKHESIYVEWGYESKPVGWKKERFVVWELHLLKE